MKVIPESDMRFGQFEEMNLFHIENSQLYEKMGSGIKTVEFILRYNKNSIIFLEAKKSCPNSDNRYDSEEKEKKFEECYLAITDKFIESLQIYIAAILDKYEDISEIGTKLLDIKSFRGIQIKCVLVIKNADERWLPGVMAELKERLKTYRKIWGIEVAVLNEELAGKYKLTC